MLKRILPFLIIYAIVLILYYPVLSTYFSHDDFFHFKVSLTDGSLAGFINFFGFHPFEERLIAFYRPVFREVLYFTFYKIFGLNQLPFRVLAFLIHFVNIYLVYNFMNKLFNKRFISYFSCFFFAITAANVSPFYYLAGGIQTQGVTMFILLTLILFINYLKTNRLRLLTVSFFTFLLALASHEQGFIIPFLMTGLILIYKGRRNSKNYFLLLVPFLITLTAYIFLNYYVIGYSSQETQYQMVFNLKSTIQTFLWYLVWAIGMPETFIDYLLPGFGLNPSLMRYFGSYYKIIFPSFFTSLCFLLISLILLLKERSYIFNKSLIFLVFWFPLGLLPFLFLPSHKSTHYLYPLLPVFWGLLGYTTYNSYRIIMKKHPNFSRLFLGIFILSLITLSSTSAILGKNTYWAAQRGRLAGKLIMDVKTKYPTLSKGSILYFINDPTYPYISESWGGTSKQAYFALNGEDALQLLYKDRSLRIFYEDIGVPNGYSKEIYPITARID